MKKVLLFTAEQAKRAVDVSGWFAVSPIDTKQAIHQIACEEAIVIPKKGWLMAVDEEMVMCHLGVANPDDDYDTAKKKLKMLIDWHVAVATDPAVNGGYRLEKV